MQIAKSAIIHQVWVEAGPDNDFSKVACLEGSDTNAKIEKLKHDRNEPIFSAEYITVAELRRRIADGKDEVGAVYRGCTSNSVWFIFFCTHPELW